MPGKALVVIDVQNDYFPGGLYPQWQAEAVLEAVLAAVARARAAGEAVILVRHEGGAEAPFFRAGSDGAALHPRLTAAAPEALVVTKTRADAFRGTGLAAALERLGIGELLLCGMMTQNCVTHTALSPEAAPYTVRVLKAGCTTVDALLNAIAFNALGDRVELV
ncbi:streptothricin hydrolase [mine drainage metagenome]|uniref:Streptothricin hydrolase n=1 Tax=mine drainage metagenome TaxID=410659 RepID=A0A1J5QQ87_9ZZZZ